MKKINTVLCPIAFYENDAQALRTAEQFCKHNNAKLTVVHVLFSIFPPYFREFGTVGNIPPLEEQRKTVGNYLDHFVRNHLSHTNNISTKVLQGDPAPAIVEFAEDGNFDLIMMPVRNRDAAGRFLLGSISYKVLSASKVPVLTIADGSNGDHINGNKVLVAMDVYFGIGKIKETLHKYFEKDTTEIELLIVIDPREEKPEQLREKRILEFEIRQFRELGFDNVSGKIVLDRHPADAIVSRAAEAGHDLIILNTHGRRGISQFVLGSTTAEVTHHAQVPVFCIKTERHVHTGNFYHDNLPV